MKKLVLFLIILAPASLFSQNTIYGGLEVSWINAEGSGGVDGISRLVPQFNAGLEFDLSDSLVMVTELAFYMDNFAFEGGAVPVETEYLGSCATLCLRFDAALRMFFTLGKTIEAYVQGGAGTILHFPLPGDDVFDLYGYFYSPLRLLDLNASGGLRLTVTEDILVDIRIRTLIPVYRLFDGSGVSILDQFQLAPGVFFVLPLKASTIQPETPAADAETI